MTLLSDSPTEIDTRPKVACFMMHTDFLASILDLPPGVRVVDIRHDGGCGQLMVRLAGDDLPDVPSNYVLYPQYRQLTAKTDGGDEVSQIKFIGWKP